MSSFTLKHLLVAVALVAVGLVAVLRANLAWAVLFQTAYYFLSFVSLAGAIYARGRRRRFWTGYAIFVWGTYAIGVLPGGLLYPELSWDRLLGVIHRGFGASDPELTFRVGHDA